MTAQELHIVLLSNDPGRAYPAFSLAMGAIAMGTKAKIYATSNGLDVVVKGGADKIQMPGMPPLSKLIEDSIKLGVKICACGPTPEFLKQMGITEDKVVEGVELEDVITFLNEALPAAQKGGIVTFI